MWERRVRKQSTRTGFYSYEYYAHVWSFFVFLFAVIFFAYAWTEKKMETSVCFRGLRCFLLALFSASPAAETFMRLCFFSFHA